MGGGGKKLDGGKNDGKPLNVHSRKRESLEHKGAKEEKSWLLSAGKGAQKPGPRRRRLPTRGGVFPEGRSREGLSLSPIEARNVLVLTTKLGRHSAQLKTECSACFSFFFVVEARAHEKINVPTLSGIFLFLSSQTHWSAF